MHAESVNGSEKRSRVLHGELKLTAVHTVNMSSFVTEGVYKSLVSTPSDVIDWKRTLSMIQNIALF